MRAGKTWEKQNEDAEDGEEEFAEGDDEEELELDTFRHIMVGGKSALFLSVAAMTRQQTVIVVVPFAALVDDIVSRGEATGLNCEEWINEQSGHELQQLIVVSADRAVRGEFRHYAKGLELEGQLAYVFFDECHVAYTDTSYRERLQELWTLRYLNCPFTGLTATLMIELEDVLKERLCIKNAKVFRRNTARKTIRYQVRDSPSDIAIKARADDEGELLQQWISGEGGWIVATRALGIGINIEGIVRIIHVSQPYGLTSFV
ncbi:hypothetical protein V502_04795 [Pseudogymnoascus sp. VKM F-4520 (FW-2644)]|nr:hypothetical protein V502_04795 [Pseudogymnoascus sp. VKM F-4520 (FW-2644)]